MCRAASMSTWARRPILANSVRTLGASSRARSLPRTGGFGATTPIALGSNSRRPSASRPGCATAKELHSTPRGGFLRPSTAAITWNSGGACTRRCKGPRSRRRSWCSSSAAPITAFDLGQQKLVLAPEYGGDGKTVGLCADKRAPIAAFPAHWAPNDLLLYDGHQFPAAYRGGAFIAFHGPWN